MKMMTTNQPLYQIGSQTPTQRAISTGTPIFLNKIQTPGTVKKSSGLRVLKAANQNTKLSGLGSSTITKGPKTYRGKSMYSLTLTERTTCPSTCQQWKTCYGNHTPFAVRYIAGDALVGALTQDLQVLNKRHPKGFVVRLHVLGDFYSTVYVRFWQEMLRTFPGLCIFGYTHREHGTPIGNAVAALVSEFPTRASILRSDSSDPLDPLAKASVVADMDSADPSITICPEQTGKGVTCTSCGLCFHGNIDIQFLRH